MINRSFIMLPGIGPRLEANLWSQDVTSWEQFISAERVEGISIKRLKDLQEVAERVMEMRNRKRMRELGTLLAPRERWRLLGEWDDRFAAIDIEVFSGDRGFIPVVLSICRGNEARRTMILGDDLCWRNFDEMLKGIDFIVTFNGSSFDIPLLEKSGFQFGQALHLDLRRYTPRAGFAGGLKAIEKQMGIERARELEFATSEQVSYLWKLWYERGNKRALDLLTSYNQRDTDTLPILANEIYLRLEEHINNIY